jgi:Big-like domain-containing protein
MDGGTHRPSVSRRGISILATLSLVSGILAVLAPGASAGSPGTGGSPQVVHFGSIIPQVSETGFISLSENAVGTNDPAGGSLTVEKPPGATVRSAYLAAATTGFSGSVLADGDVAIDGNGVNWDLSTPNAISSNNYWSNVTTLVKAKLDAAAAGPVSFLITEANFNTDGEILAVIWNDPNQVVSNTIVLLFGAQNITGDTFNVGLAEPIDKSDPNLRLDMALGISFSFQPSGQFSTVDVNSQRLSSAAGGQDDGQGEDGALITVGGVGDSNANPVDPNALPTDPRSDDELYSLLPFVNTGDTSIQVFTQNPSSDDNIFFGALTLNSTTAVVGEGIVLAPVDAQNPVDTNHTLTATVQDTDGNPIAGRTVTFTVIAGPSMGTTGTGTTGVDGKATFTYSSSAAGVDEIQASFLNSAGQTVLSNVARKEWLGGDSTRPSCRLTARRPGPPVQIDVTVQDSGSGLASVLATNLQNATVVVPPFAVGSTNPLIVTATKGNQSLRSRFTLRAQDVAGNVTRCTASGVISF